MIEKVNKYVFLRNLKNYDRKKAESYIYVNTK